MKFFFLTIFAAAALVINTDAGAEPLGQEIKQVLQSELDRTEAMAKKFDLIRSHLANQSKPPGHLSISEFLQVTRQIDCTKDPSSLQDAIESEVDASALYLISGKCILDRPIQVIGRTITVLGAASASDPNTKPSDLATVLLDYPPGSGALGALSGGAWYFHDLFIETTGDGKVDFTAYSNGVFAMIRVGLPEQVEVTAYRSGSVIFYEYLSLGSLEQEATEAEFALSTNQAVSRATFRLFNGGNARILSNRLNADFDLAGGASLDFVALEKNAEPSKVSFHVRTGSTARIINFSSELAIENAIARSNSTIGHIGYFLPSVTQKSSSAFIGPEYEGVY